jgi:cytochrome c
MRVPDAPCKTPAVAALLLMALAAPAAILPATGADLVEEGRHTAERLCSRCHAIEGPGPSAVPAAPPFSGIGRRLQIDDLAESLAEGILTGHGPVEMPEIVLSPEEIDGVLAYLHSVQE